ncbi:uncharacterized protein EV422DRAFT_507358 [Fimicolochytrium jonesii]|uniref:uncharacterized protein n=1 Tax=Fimicolochytrium jonesii TaxID=1396493 RepID=UPI0022FDEDB6|nr:uncharacterized protein EV422DRAFT_507358 [Fimicolochytrium jonesii]KAI8819738.1 hypothetical protein EV422DRAFT_507358 [Fimicolochytrium jonesii]
MIFDGILYPFSAAQRTLSAYSPTPQGTSGLVLWKKADGVSYLVPLTWAQNLVTAAWWSTQATFTFSAEASIPVDETFLVGNQTEHVKKLPRRSQLSPRAIAAVAPVTSPALRANANTAPDLEHHYIEKETRPIKFPAICPSRQNLSPNISHPTDLPGAIVRAPSSCTYHGTGPGKTAILGPASQRITLSVFGPRYAQYFVAGAVESEAAETSTSALFADCVMQQRHGPLTRTMFGCIKLMENYVDYDAFHNPVQVNGAQDMENSTSEVPTDPQSAAEGIPTVNALRMDIPGQLKLPTVIEMLFCPVKAKYMASTSSWYCGARVPPAKKAKKTGPTEAERKSMPAQGTSAPPPKKNVEPQSDHFSALKNLLTEVEDLRAECALAQYPPGN